MSNRAKVGGWLQGKTVRKGGITSTNNTRSSTPQIQSTSSTVFGGGVKDASGRTSEYFVCLIKLRLCHVLTVVQSMDDQCPVCKSDRYLNRKLRLLVSSCYHKMSAWCYSRCLRPFLTLHFIGANHVLTASSLLGLRHVLYAIRCCANWRLHLRRSKTWVSKKR